MSIISAAKCAVTRCYPQLQHISIDSYVTDACILSSYRVLHPHFFQWPSACEPSATQGHSSDLFPESHYLPCFRQKRNSTQYLYRLRLCENANCGQAGRKAPKRMQRKRGLRLERSPLPCRPHPRAASSEHQPAQEGWEYGKLKHEGPPHLGDVKPGRSDLLQLARCSLSRLRELGASEQETDLFQGPVLILPRR